MNRTAVVIPLFNHEKYIVDTLQSVLNQTRPPERIIIVDDGSRDQSVACARSIDDSSITIIEQENSGAHSALNRGIEIADDCDIIAILNSDDRYTPTRLQTTIDALNALPATGLLCTGLTLIDDTNKPLPPDESRNHWFHAAWSPAGSDLSLPEWLGIANFVGTTSNFVARRNWLRKNPFRPYRYVHDYFNLVLASVRDELHVLHQPLLEYRVHGTNTISTKPENLTRELIAMNLDLLSILAPLQSDPDIRARTAAYFRTAWANVSAFRMDVFQSLLIQLAAAVSEEEKKSSLDSILQYPELTSFPNKAAVNLFDGRETLRECSGLAERVASLSADLKSSEAARKKLEKDLARHQPISRSFWLRTGALLGSRRCKEFLAHTK